ncbi:MAG: NAD(P)H-hydrate dehydratase [Pseudomonadota bacterium]
MTASQVLTTAQMRAAEQAMFDAGVSEYELMKVAAIGAAEWVRRVAAGRQVTILCGPGNNGGDGFVIARLCHKAGLGVDVIALMGAKSATAKQAYNDWMALSGSKVLSSGKGASGSVFVDCLFGSGLSRPLSAEHALLLRDLAQRHATRVAVDVPSGIDSDTGDQLAETLPRFDLTLALGAWKFAHCAAAARAIVGQTKLVPIGIGSIDAAAKRVIRPKIEPPAYDAHKYTRGLCAIVAGSMPGASLLAGEAAARAGAGYVKLFSECSDLSAPPNLVVDNEPIENSLCDSRISAVLVGQGLGRDAGAKSRLRAALQCDRPLVLDADALILLAQDDVSQTRLASVVATPHEGELATLCRTFGVIAQSRIDRVRALAKASGMIIVAKGPDTYLAAPEGDLAIGPAASSWLSTAGTGDVLAGTLASRLATGVDAFKAACEAIWLHAEAARMLDAGFTSHELARSISKALQRCL